MVTNTKGKRWFVIRCCRKEFWTTKWSQNGARRAPEILHFCSIMKIYEIMKILSSIIRRTYEIWEIMKIWPFIICRTSGALRAPENFGVHNYEILRNYDENHQNAETSLVTLFKVRFRLSVSEDCSATIESILDFSKVPWKSGTTCNSIFSWSFSIHRFIHGK